MKTSLLLFAIPEFIFWLSVFPKATNRSVNNDGMPPNNSAMLEVKSSNKGLLPLQ